MSPYITYIKKTDVDAFWKSRGMRPVLIPFVIACIVYHPSWGNETYHTPFILNIRRVRGETTPGRSTGAGIYVDEGPIPSSDLKVLAYPVAGQAD